MEFEAFRSLLDAVNQRETPAPLTDAEDFDVSLPVMGRTGEQLVRLFRDYVLGSVHTASPLFMNQLWGGSQEVAVQAELLTALMNTSMYTREVAPIATKIERALIQKMGTLAGFENPEGQFTTGGSNGNLMALLMARQRMFPQAKVEGMSEGMRPVIFVSEESHYSLEKAAMTIGMGSQQVWKVPADDRGRLHVDALKALIGQAREDGLHPMMITATAGTTVRGAFDSIDEMADVAESEGLWLHVDGAWGGAALLSKRHRHLLEGVSRADSLVWDAHKMMGMPLMCSALIVKERGMMKQSFDLGNGDYIFHDDEGDLGPETLHCGRRNDALKLFMSWQSLGDRGWEQLIDRYLSLAEYAEQIIEQHPQLRLVCPRDFTNLCFQVIPEEPVEDMKVFMKYLRKRLMDSGTVMVNQATVRGEQVLRLVICNPGLHRQHLEAFFRQVVKLGMVG